MDKIKMKEMFYSCLSEKPVKKNSFQMTTEKYENLIKEVKEAKSTAVKINRHYWLLKHYDILTMAGKEHLIVPIRNDIILFYVSVEQIFDILYSTHESIGHGGRDRMRKELQKQYKNVTLNEIQMFLNLCEVCQQKKKSEKKGIFGHKALTNHDKNTGSIENINFHESNAQCEFRQQKRIRLSGTILDGKEDTVQITSNLSNLLAFPSKIPHTKSPEMCRTCLQPRTTLVAFDKFVLGSEGHTILEFLTFLNYSNLSESDNAPKHVCIECFKKLQANYSFQLQCIKSEQYWRAKSLDNDTSISSYIQPLDTTVDDESNFSMEDPLNTESKITIKPEFVSADELNLDIKEEFIKQEPDDNFVNSELENNMENESIVKIEPNSETNQEPCSSNFRHRERVEITCSLCKIQFNDETFFWDHFRETHSNNSTIQIVPCREHFQTFYSDEIYFYCKTCELYSKNENNLVEHFKVHSDLCYNECYFCAETFKNAEIYYVHLKEHFDKLK